MSYCYLLSWLLCLCSVIGFSQNITKTEKKAEKTFYSEEFRSALPIYNRVLELDPDNKNALYKAELCSLLLPEFRNRSLETILSYSETQGRRDKFYNYWLGRIYLTRYRPLEAITAWQAFLDLKAYKSSIITEETRTFIKIAEQCQTWLDSPSLYKVEKVNGSINSNLADLSPTLLNNNQLVYASRNKDNGEIQLFLSNQSGEMWEQPSLVSQVGELKHTNFDIDFLRDNKVVFKNGSRQIQVITVDNGQWGTPEPFHKLPGKRAKSHFTINQAEDRIIFSQMDISGNLDLYETQKQDDKWSSPEFLYNLNSNLNEDSPFLSSDGTKLYFSSEGHDAMGGFDVMVSVKSGTEWLAPTNLGYPINTLDNELHFSANTEGKRGFLSSDRLGSEGYDIYAFHEITFDEVEGIIADARTGLQVPGLRIEFQSANYPERYSDFTDEIGSYKTRIMSSEDYLVKIYDNETVILEEKLSANDLSLSNNRRNYEVIPTRDRGKTLAQSLTTNENAEFGEDGYSPLNFIANKFRPGNKAILKNLYFESGSSRLMKGSYRVLSLLEQILIDYPELHIEVAGHTDSRGEEEFNMWLSKKRAQAIMNTLVSDGVPPDQLMARGYGESKPIASNDDELEGRALNRRIEIMVIE